MVLQTVAEREGFFAGADGWQLFYRAWLPSTDPKAVLLAIHGLGSHSGTFARLAEMLVGYGYALYGLDLRGHGRSQGQRGFIRSWEDYRSDVDSFLDWVDRQTDNCTRFLVGHSLGAVVVLDFAMRMQPSLAGAIALAPALGTSGVPPVKLAAGQLLSSLWPRFTLNTGIDPQKGARDPQLLEEFLNDPLRHTKGTARLATEFFDTVDWVRNHPYLLQVPLLILHGESDAIALPESSAEFIKQLQHPDTSRLAYPHCYHDIHRDLSCDSVVEDLVDWLAWHSDNDCCQLGLPPVQEIVA